MIEVKVPDGAKGWQQVVNSNMSQALDKLSITVEDLGGKVQVQYGRDAETKQGRAVTLNKQMCSTIRASERAYGWDG